MLAYGVCSTTARPLFIKIIVFLNTKAIDDDYKRGFLAAIKNRMPEYLITAEGLL